MKWAVVQRKVHAARLLVLTATLLAVAGCAPILRFEGLTPASTEAQAARISVVQNGEPAPNYRLKPDDLLVFEIPNARGGLEPISAVRVNGAEQWLCCASSSFRIAVHLADNFRLTFDAASLSPRPGRFKLRLTNRTWAEVVEDARNETQDHAQPGRDNPTGNKVRFRLEPGSGPDLLAAGDVVQLERQYRIKFAQFGEPAPGQPTSDPYSVMRAERFDLAVDSQGQALFPALSQLSNPIGTDEDAAARRVMNQLENANAVLQVADPKAPYDQQLSLNALALCLSEGELFNEDPSSRCWAAGVRRALAPTTEGSVSVIDLVYRLTPALRTWWLVDEDGRRVEVPLRWGDTAPSAVRREYERGFGRSLFRGLWRAFVVVTPRQTIAADRERPFYLNVQEERPATTEYLIRPGDTVFITRARPLPQKARP